MHSPELMNMIKDEPPLPASARFIASGPLNALMAEAARLGRQIERERKQAQREANVHCNYKFCRRNKCGQYKIRCCWKKTFEEQKACADSRGYEKEEVLVPEVV